MSKITVIGSTNIDLIMKTNDLPARGETVTGGEFMQTFGGKGANQAVGAARAGGQVSFISCVGDDHYGEQSIENFKSDGINTDNIFIEKGITTGTAIIMIGKNGNTIISVASGANSRMSPEHIDKSMKLIKESEYVLIQYEIPEETLCYIIKQCAEHKIKVIFNLAPANDFDHQYFNLIDTLVVNEVEAESLVKKPLLDMEEIKLAAAKLLELGPNNVIITLGANGSFVASGKYYEKLPAFKVTALDSTAAGDVYCGSLAVALVEGMPLHKAVGFASAASAISVTRLGAQLSAPYRTEIEELLQKED